jgi:uncharacterized repeat protein (TIGR01451 family)
MDWNRIQPGRSQPRRLMALVLCVLALGGCQNFQLPRINPSGESIFLPPGAPSQASPYANSPYGMTPPYNPGAAGAQPPLPGTTVIAPPVLSAPQTPAPSALPPGISSPMVQSPLQTPQPTLPPVAAQPPLTAPVGMTPANTGVPMLAGAPGPPQPGLSITPGRVVAPVGSEVVMVASLCAVDGFMVTSQPVEWMIDRGGVGTFISPGERGTFDCINRLRGLPRKVDATYALNTTVRQYQHLDRGTPVPFDDVEVQPGQAWVTVTSPVEGTTNLTVYAPEVPEWDRRQKTAVIHWVDAQWNFPPPAINPVGTRHTFTTSVSRQTDGTPIEGWTVRYEIVGGPAAQWVTTGNTVIDVPTSELGQASAEIQHTEQVSGMSQINGQNIRPAEGPGGRKYVIGNGSTTKTCTKANICINTIGPMQAAVGTTASYRIEINNPSPATATNVVVTDNPPRALTFQSSTPTADASPSGQEWKLGDLQPGQTKSIDVQFRVGEAGNFNYCATVTADGGCTASDCITTNAAGAEARPLDVRINGPASANVGSSVDYQIEVVNVGTTAATSLIVTDTFDDGLEHAVSASPIERDIKDLAPGQSERFNVRFRVTKPGQLCQLVEVRGAGGLRSSNRACLTAIVPGGSRLGDDSSSVTDPRNRDRTDRTETQPPPMSAYTGPHLTVKKTGPVRKRVGETAEFTIEVTNDGSETANNLRIADNYDQSLDPVAATDGWVISGGALVWTVGKLEPGKTIKRQINCECLQPTFNACNRVTVTADGIAAVAGEACLEVSRKNDPLRPSEDPDETPPPISPNPIRPDAGSAPDAAKPRFEPAPRPRGGIAPATGLTLTVSEQRDPVRVGEETTYQVVLANRTNSGDRGARLSIEIPENMTLVGVEGPVRAPRILNRTAEFEPIAELRANESITFQVRCRAVEPGDGRFSAKVTSENQPSGARAEEPTQVVR